MANMSYCRFENTVADMQDCLYDLGQAVADGLSFAQFMDRLSSADERQAVRRLADMLADMTEVLEQLNDNEGLSEEELEELEGVDN